MNQITKVIEVSASSADSIEDAVKRGLRKVAESVKHIKGAWINETKVVTSEDGSILEWRVNLRVSFVVE
jgi:dodecin